MLLMHLLKYRHQETPRSRSWTFTIHEQRRALEDLLDESRSLRPAVAERMAKACRLARVAAERET